MLNIFEDKDWKKKAIELLKSIPSSDQYEAQVLAYYLLKHSDRMLLQDRYIYELTAEQTANNEHIDRSTVFDRTKRALMHYYALYCKITKAYEESDMDINEES